MSRSGYSDDCDGWSLIRWRGAVASAIRGKRGQAFLREMLESLDAIPSKRLINHDLQNSSGEVCALGSVGLKRGINMKQIDVDDRKAIAAAMGISEALAAEIMFINDDDFCYRNKTPEQRYNDVRNWVTEQLAKS